MHRVGGRVYAVEDDCILFPRSSAYTYACDHWWLFLQQLKGRRFLSPDLFTKLVSKSLTRVIERISRLQSLTFAHAGHSCAGSEHLQEDTRVVRRPRHNSHKCLGVYALIGSHLMGGV